VNVAEALQTGTDTLATAGVDTPRVDAEWLMTHVLDCPRHELVLRHEEVLTEAKQSQWDVLMIRRAARIPLQHLLGSVEFCGLVFEVNENVLIPRPETELLAEGAWQFANVIERPVILDVGTGSGCLAIAIAVNCSQAEVHALDVSAQALAVARANAARHQVQEGIIFHEADGRRELPSGTRFDLIVSNPPYIPTAEIPKLQAEVHEHDPHLALDGGRDGLEFYRALATHARERLQPAGRMMLEIGDGQAEMVSALLLAAGWRVLEVFPDLNNVQRIVIASPANP
jgi:release factor glutamine methyltransferase